MTVDRDYFDDTVGIITPQPWNQLRMVATGSADGITMGFPATNAGVNYDSPLHDVTVQWTNDTPVNQAVYGMATRGGAVVSLQARSRGYLLSQHGYSLDGSVPTLVDVSRVGCGVDRGLGGIFAGGVNYGISEYHQNSVTMPFMPNVPQLITVAPGQTITARVAVRFRSEYWESVNISGGTAFTQSYIVSGDTRLDLYALPARAVTPQQRVTPTIVGETHASAINAPVTVNAVPNVQPGDILMAIVVNQFDLGSKILPPPGWVLSVSAGLSDWFWNDVHLAVFTKTVSENEPGTYTFGNGIFAEEYVNLIAIRDASPLRSEWEFTAQMTRPAFWEQAGSSQTVAPINADGQLLIGLAYVGHPTNQTITETPPASLTTISTFSGVGSSFAAGYMRNPTNPTPELVFTSSQAPSWGGHSITAGLVIPGRWA